MKIKAVYNRKNRPGKQAVEIYFYINRADRIYLPTEIKIDPNQWDKSRGLIINHPEADILNNIVKQKILELETEYLRAKFDKTKFSTNKFKKANKDASGKADDFISFAKNKLDTDLSIQHQSKRPQYRSLQELKAIFNVLPFEKIDLEAVTKYDNHLRKQGYTHNTIRRFHKDFKKFIRLGISHDLIKAEKNPYLHFKLKSWEAKTEFLQSAEIEAIEKADLQGVELAEIARDMFLFSIYTGLRFGDLHSLTKSDFDERPGGLVLYLKQSEKTGIPIFLRLNELFDGKPEKIARKYLALDNQHKNIWGVYFTNQRYNQTLKAIQQNAGIKTLLTGHLGRHTFGTHLAKQTGNILFVMGCMGIKQFSTAKIYINIAHQLD